MNNWIYLLLGIIATTSLLILYFVILILAKLNKKDTEILNKVNNTNLIKDNFQHNGTDPEPW